VAPFLLQIQAMEMRGGARVDRDAGESANGVLERDSATLPATSRPNAGTAQGCGLADRDVVTARQQSWLQQPEARTSNPADSEGAEPWHW
jgi:hypothetical protein